MPTHICITCGTHYPDAPQPPSRCMICDEERQYVNWSGQTWTTPEELRVGHRNEFRPQGERIVGVGTAPKFAIGQRALLAQTSEGNVLWDCNSLVDDATVEAINARGGLRAIAISHPHFYSGMVEWSRRFGGIPVYVHADDERWAARRADEIVFWRGESLPLFGGVTLIRCGGHFDGSAAAHWAEGEGGAGSLFTGDTLYVVQDRRYVSFMRSFPNYIPLSARAVRRIAAAVAPFAFERIYSAWWDAIVDDDGSAAVQRSAERYIRAIEGERAAERGSTL